MSSQKVSGEQQENSVLSSLTSGLEFTRKNFDNPALEWRRLFSEVLGTFLLVIVAAGGGTINAVSNGQISRTAAVTAPGLMVLAVILFMGAVSGAHLNPAVSIAFATRGDFPWRRVPGYIIAQLVGATLACLLLRALFGNVGMLGATEPGSGINVWQALIMEFVLTAGLVSTILGTSLQGAEPRADLGVRGGCIHHPRRTLVKPDQWGVDESGAFVRSGPGALELFQLLGLHRGPDRRCARSPLASPTSCGVVDSASRPRREDWRRLWLKTRNSQTGARRPNRVRWRTGMFHPVLRPSLFLTYVERA